MGGLLLPSDAPLERVSWRYFQKIYAFLVDHILLTDCGDIGLENCVLSPGGGSETITVLCCWNRTPAGSCSFVCMLRSYQLQVYTKGYVVDILAGIERQRALRTEENERPLRRE